MKTESPPGAPAAESNADFPPHAQRHAADQAAAEAFHDAAVRIREIREYVSYYVAAKADALKLSVRRAVLFAVLGIIGALAGGAMVVMGVALLLIGAAHGIGAALGDRAWLGDLIIGVVAVVLLVVIAKVATSRIFKISRTQTVAKYESRKRDQRSRFGQDVKQRAGQI